MRWSEQVMRTLTEAGFTFTKRDEDGWWEFKSNGLRIDDSRSLGDLLRKYGKEFDV